MLRIQLGLRSRVEDLRSWIDLCNKDAVIYVRYVYYTLRTEISQFSEFISSFQDNVVSR